MTEKEEESILSYLGVNQVFEGIGNIINVVGRIIEEGGLSQKKEADEKTPVCPDNSQ